MLKNYINYVYHALETVGNLLGGSHIEYFEQTGGLKAFKSNSTQILQPYDIENMNIDELLSLVNNSLKSMPYAYVIGYSHQKVILKLEGEEPHIVEVRFDAENKSFDIVNPERSQPLEILDCLSTLKTNIQQNFNLRLK